MTNDEELKELVKGLCGEVRYDKVRCGVLSDQLYSQAKHVTNGIVCDISSLTHNASTLRAAYEKYWCRKRDLLRICEALGDEYLEIYKNILEDN